jgi:beta-lactamase regulating signal transducer with metallopeptidase domain
MSILSALVVVLRASFLLALSLCVLPALRGTSASLRRFLVLLGLLASLGVPLLALGLQGRPALQVPAPAFVGHVVAEALAPNVTPVSRHGAGKMSAQARSFSLRPSTWLTVIWALGALVVAVRAARAGLWTWRLSVAAQPVISGVRLSSEIEAPVVVGLFSPVVLLPISSQEWSDERRHAVLLHELSHVRRYDGLALAVAQLACALYWFQPLAWLARNRLRRECELAADEAVIAAGLRPTCYAQHLLAIARGLVPAGGIAMAARASELSRRIHVLISRERLPAPFTRSRAALIAAVAVFALANVACVDIGTKPGQTPVDAGKSAKASDPRLQSIAEEEARRVHAEWGAERVAILVLDPHTGALLASSDDAPGKPIVPASTLKPFAVATALDAGLITPEQRFDCGNGARNYGDLVLRDGGSYGSLNAGEILAVSSNIGVSRIFDVLGGERLGDGLRRFHIGAPADIPSGTVRGAVIALGQGSTTTPLSLASAYGVFANDGLLAVGGSASPERVIRASTARTIRSMLEGAVNGEHATGKAAVVAGVRVGGKTGTSDDSASAQSGGPFMSFVGIVPIDAPRWVVYVGVGKPNRDGSGATVAAPVFSRVATRALRL